MPQAVPTRSRATELFEQYQSDLHQRTDRLFAGLLGFPVDRRHPVRALGLAARVVGHRQPHARPRLGGDRSRRRSSACFRRCSASCGLAGRRRATRSRVAQMLMGALLIHLTGGRIETHFHVFGSLAFLAFYRDWRVLIPGHHRRGAGSPAARHVLAAVGLRRAGREPVALAGARGLGGLRRRLPARLVPSAASPRCGRRRSARRRSNRRSGRASRPRTTRGAGIADGGRRSGADARHRVRTMLQQCAEALVQHLDGGLARIWTLERRRADARAAGQRRHAHASSTARRRACRSASARSA